MPSRAWVALFAGCIFVSAFLLFQVQPMVGKRILPWFGGVPGVWTLCLAFYQVTLFLGYAYAHLLCRSVSGRWQPVLHAGLFAAALTTLPVLPGEAWKPDAAEAPALRIAAMLVANVGLPFLFLSASGPLLQAWFVRAARGRSPYRLYAVSNAGSFLALLSYPFLIEPSLPLSVGSRAWSGAFVLLGLSVLACGWLARPDGDSGVPAATPASPTANAPAQSDPIGWVRCGAWISLSACAVVLLMGVTNELCLDVASVPFLWVAPLAIYLVTFILCFASDAPLARGWAVLLAGSSLIALLALGSSSLSSTTPGAASFELLVALYSLLLLFHCLALHRELYALRPPPERLTIFYLCISLGGALGGLFVGIGASRWFPDYYELPLGLAVCWVLLALCWLRASPGRRPVRKGRALAIVAALVGALVLTLLVAPPAQRPDGTVIHQLRNFFGVLRVVDLEPEKPREHRRLLKSGTTTHGLQFVNAPKRARPTLYFGEFTGVGFALRAVTERVPAARVGVVGLGVGTLASYGRRGDLFRFYEIDPDVIRIARDPAYFTYLADAAARVEVVPGDGRLSLEREFSGVDAARFHLLVLDAFSSDAIPVHLLTREAFGVYQRALRPDGLLLVHVSNANLSLAPLVFGLGRELGMSGLAIENREPPRALQARATWVALSADPDVVAAVERAIEVRRASMAPAQQDPWLARPTAGELAAAPRFTDDYSDVLQLLRSE